MNIEKIYIAVQNDEMNSALGNICLELEKQGYKIKIEDIEITSEEIITGKAEYLEQYPNKYNFLIENSQKEKQKFSIRFTEYHKFIFEQE